MRPPLFTGVLVACIALTAAASGAERILMEWDFSKATDTLGWTNAEPIKEIKIADGALLAIAGPGRQKLESPLFDISANPWQYVEIELKTDSDGTGLMYYSNTTEEPYHGFRPGQYAQFTVTGDSKYHTYRIRPFWQKQGKITHIRLDPPGNSVYLRSVRIIDQSPGEPSKATAWKFGDSLAGWQAQGINAKATPSKEFCVLEGDRESVLFSPPVDINADEYFLATVRIGSKTPHTAVLRFATDQSDGFHSVPIQLRDDGIVHSYAIDLSEMPEWTGRVLAIGLTPTETSEIRQIALESIAFGESVQGPPELLITRFGLADPVTRVGEQARLIVSVKNIGGADAQSVAAVVTLAEKKTDDAPEAPKVRTLITKRVPKLPPGETVDFEWTFEAESDAPRIAVCRVTGKDLDAGEKQIDLRFYPKLNKSQLSNLKYVPEPKPADTNDYLVGCYYFPGWHTYDRWSVLENYPERKPILGYYREGDPEVADWQIKWALEHGISFFIYDWYWDQGARQLEHGLHDAYLKSRYKDKLKFCLLWANHNPPNTSSEKDLLEVTQYWIDNYFKLPNYLKLDGKNVMVIFSPHRLTEDMGSDAVKAAFFKMRKKCEDAGVGGLYLIACTYPGEYVKTLVYEGYDALSGYNYPSANNKGQQYAPYEWMVEGYKDFWNRISDAASIPYIPVCEPGWDARPWHGLKSYVRTGKSPFLWKTMLENAKAFVDDPKHKQDGNKKLVFLEAWNEFGEGDYIEPHAQFGFDCLEAVREVFAPQSQKPEIIVPKDIGLGPYDLKPSAPKTAWEFSNPEDCTWYVGNMRELNCEGGVMRAKAANNDPAFYSPATRIDASKLKTVEIKMRMDKGTEAQLFFARPRGRMTEQGSIRFPVKADGEFHVYTLDMSVNRLWRGIIGQIRLDPNSEAGSSVEVAYVRVK